MLQQYKNKREEGFTIIEVLIVLAIAGLILLIVFLAVPALQRNNRNTSRNNDASRISALVTECLGNRNGDVDSCDEDDEIGFNADNFSIIEGVDLNNGNTGNFGDLTTVQVDFNSVCTESGSEKDDGNSRRQFTVAYQLEASGGTNNRCVGSE